MVDGERARGNFAADTPLVKAADAQVTALLGHAIAFRIDAALLPRWQVQLETVSEQSIDAVAHTLATLEERHPAMFAWMAPKLRQVRCRMHPVPGGCANRSEIDRLHEGIDSHPRI